MAKVKSKQEVFNEIIHILKDLNKKYPNQDILRHISDATSEYKSIWGISNKEFLFTLEKYQTNMYLPNEDEITKIVNDGKKIGKEKYLEDFDDFSEEENYIGEEF